MAPASYDAILLDVDNGPDFLVHQANANVYQRPFLTAESRTLRPGGMLAVWSAAPSVPLVSALAATVGAVDTSTTTSTWRGRSHRQD